MDKNRINFNSKEYNENKINIYFYTKEVHKKSKENINNLHKYKSNKNISVLIGDSYQPMAIITNSILESVGCKTTIAPNGNSLIQEFKENPNGYDAIITNNTYSNGNTGKKILQLAKKIRKDIKVIVLTTEKNKAKHFINIIGFDGYLERPLDQKKAISILTALIPELKFNKTEPIYFTYKNKNKKKNQII